MNIRAAERGSTIIPMVRQALDSLARPRHRTLSPVVIHLEPAMRAVAGQQSASLEVPVRRYEVRKSARRRVTHSSPPPLAFGPSVLLDNFHSEFLVLTYPLNYVYFAVISPFLGALGDRGSVCGAASWLANPRCQLVSPIYQFPYNSVRITNFAT